MTGHRSSRHRACGIGILLFAVAWGPVAAERHLYAIAGQPMAHMVRSFPVVLYRVEDGGLTKMRTVATRLQDPLHVEVYQGKGFAFVASDGATQGTFVVDILDLDDMSNEKSVDFDVCHGCYHVRSHLLQRGDQTIYYLRASSENEQQNLGFDLGSDQFVRDIGRGDDTFAYSAGGPWGLDGNRHIGGIYIRQDSPGQPYLIRDPDTFDLDWRLPDWFPAQKARMLIQTINNEHVRVLFRGGDFDERFVLDKESDTWSTVPLSSLPLGKLKAFRHWLTQERRSRDGFDATRVDAELLATYRSPPFSSALERFRFLETTPTGDLLFYDTRSATLTEHRTGDPDSEILLIDGDDVAYFRVGDELRRGDLRDGELTNEGLVAKAPELWGVHWLVEGRE